MEKTVEDLLEAPYWVIDVLPKKVPDRSPGRYFAVEEYYLTEPRRSEIKRKHIDLVLKLYCYRRLMTEDAEPAPPPELIADRMLKDRVLIMTDGALLVSEPDCLYMTLYGPDAALLKLVRELAKGEGLYVWKP
ncbi:MAG: hypothetical protein J5586_08245 [Clostridia bacterium]|nr:hypothetical protein [Clostridia bacterium]